MVDDKKSNIPIGLKQVPQHLQSLLDSASDSLTDDQMESLRLLLVEYQDVFMGPDGKLGRTDLVKHTIDKEMQNPLKYHQEEFPKSK